MSKKVKLEASVVNGELLSFPVELYVPCEYHIVGEQCRSFTDINECTYRLEHLYISINSSEYGLKMTKEKFIELMGEECKPCVGCGRSRCKCINITINGCLVTIGLTPVSLPKVFPK